MLNTTQHRIGNDQDDAAKIFRVVGEVDVKPTLEKDNRSGIRRYGLEAHAIPEAPMNTRRSRTRADKGSGVSWTPGPEENIGGGGHTEHGPLGVVHESRCGKRDAVKRTIQVQRVAWAGS